MASYMVTVRARLEPDIDPSATGIAVMAELLELGAADSDLARDGHIIEIHVSVEATTQADALAEAARLVARALDGEPVHDVTAHVAHHTD